MLFSSTAGQLCADANLTLATVTPGHSLGDGTQLVLDFFQNAAISDFYGNMSIGVFSPCRAQANRVKMLRDAAAANGTTIDENLSEECSHEILKENLGGVARGFKISSDGEDFELTLHTENGNESSASDPILAISVNGLPKQLVANLIGGDGRRIPIKDGYVLLPSDANEDIFSAWGDPRCLGEWDYRKPFPEKFMEIDCGRFIRVAEYPTGTKVALIESSALMRILGGDPAFQEIKGLLVNIDFVLTASSDRYLEEVRRTDDLNFRYDTGGTALEFSISQRRIDRVVTLLKEGASVETTDGIGNSPLHLAVSWDGNSQLLSLLVDAGADLNKTNKSGETPVLAAVRFRNIAAVRYLASVGADLAIAAGETTPLDLAMSMANGSTSMNAIIEALGGEPIIQAKVEMDPTALRELRRQVAGIFLGPLCTQARVGASSTGGIVTATCEAERVDVSNLVGGGNTIYLGDISGFQICPVDGSCFVRATMLCEWRGLAHAEGCVEYSPSGFSYEAIVYFEKGRPVRSVRR
jgi:hypothetical protein